MKKEEDILIYQSWWKNTITGLFLIILAGMSIYGYIIGKIPVWTLIAAILIGICGLILLYIFVKQQLKHAPYMVITDESVKVLLGKGMEFKFADVEDFFLLGYPLSSSVIGIHYKEGVQQRKMEEASKAGRIVRKFNEKTAGAQEGVPASGLTVRPKVLCRMLNERLEQYRQRHDKPKKV